MSDLNYLRAAVSYRVACISPLAIGSGWVEQGVADSRDDKRAESVPRAVVRGHDNKSCIPGSSLRGWLRAKLPPDLAASLFGELLDGKTRAGRVDVGSAHAGADETVETSTRFGHARDAVTGAVADHLLYTREWVPVGTTFDAELRLRHVSHAELSTLVAALNAADGGLDYALGAATQSGLGRVSVAVTDVRVCDSDQLRRWWRGDTPHQLRTLDTAALDTADVAARRALCWPMSLRPLSAFLTEERGGDAGHSGTGRGNHKVPLLHNGHAIMPGSSLKGALRHEAFRIVQSVLLAQAGQNVSQQAQFATLREVTESAVAELFGSSEKTGRLAVSDFISANNVKTCKRHFNAVDRFTGGAADQRLFTADVVYCEALNGEIAWRHAASAVVSEPALRFLCALVLRECWHGQLWLGWGSRRGLGEMALTAQKPETGFGAWVEDFVGDINAGETEFNRWMQRCSETLAAQHQRESA